MKKAYSFTLTDDLQKLIENNSQLFIKFNTPTDIDLQVDENIFKCKSFPEESSTYLLEIDGCKESQDELMNFTLIKQRIECDKQLKNENFYQNENCKEFVVSHEESTKNIIGSKQTEKKVQTEKNKKRKQHVHTKVIKQMGIAIKLDPVKKIRFTELPQLSLKAASLDKLELCITAALEEKPRTLKDITSIVINCYENVNKKKKPSENLVKSMVRGIAEFVKPNKYKMKPKLESDLNSFKNGLSISVNTNLQTNQNEEKVESLLGNEKVSKYKEYVKIGNELIKFQELFKSYKYMPGITMDDIVAEWKLKRTYIQCLMNRYEKLHEEFII